MSLPTQARLLELFDYSIVSGKLYWKVTTGSRAKAGVLVGSKHLMGYLTVRVEGKSFLLHRVIWCMLTGCWPIAMIDHIDTLGTNNSWLNLREATNQENLRNRPVQVNSKTGVKGVYLRDNRYRVRLYVEGKHKYLGSFLTLLEAKEARETAAKQYHGEFYHA